MDDSGPRLRGPLFKAEAESVVGLLGGRLGSVRPVIQIERLDGTAEGRLGHRAGQGVEGVAAESVPEIGRRRRVRRPVQNDEIRIGAAGRIGSGAHSAGQERRRRVARQAEGQRRRAGRAGDGAGRQAEGRRHLGEERRGGNLFRPEANVVILIGQLARSGRGGGHLLPIERLDNSGALRVILEAIRRRQERRSAADHRDADAPTPLDRHARPELENELKVPAGWRHGEVH